MTLEEIGKVLTIASEIDPRVTVTVERAKVWHMVVGDVDYDFAVEAVKKHYQESTNSLMPADIVPRKNPDAWMDEKSWRDPGVKYAVDAINEVEA